MAEPIFDEHPLGQYFQESGDCPQVMPGSVETLEGDTRVDNAEHSPPAHTGGTLDFFCLLLRELSNTTVPWLSSVGLMSPTAQREFAERFKYDVISSNLLSSAASSPVVAQHNRRRSQDPAFQLSEKFAAVSPSRQTVRDSRFFVILVLFVASGFLGLFYDRLITTVLLIISLLCLARPYVSSAEAKGSHVAQTFEVLEHLKTTGEEWDTVVNESLTLLEAEERNGFYHTSPSTLSPSSSMLRVAFNSSLVTTQQQCDNVRQLLSALTSPSELSQLSEMYAPASPVKAAFSLPNPQSLRTLNHRSFSNTERKSMNTTSPTSKRQTWNGGRLSMIETRSMPVLHRRTRHRSDLSAVVDINDCFAESSSTPTTPAKARLAEVSEDNEDLELSSEELQDTFGSAALQIRRNRQRQGAEILGISPSPSTQGSFRSPSSRFTTMQTSRHSLSLPALHLTLQNALASKRFACSYLLALRFDDDDNEGYWEDVRSIMKLLSSALEDATSRLSEALDHAEKQRQKDEQPTSPSECSHNPLSREGSVSPPISKSPSPMPTPFPRLYLHGSNAPLSFAPSPHSLTRFAGHVDAMSSALEDARQQLKECIEGLKEDRIDGDLELGIEREGREQIVLLSYERLRRELGLALRECERGKSALSDVFEARRRERFSRRDDEEEDEDEMPSLAPDGGSGSLADSDDKHDLTPATPPSLTVPLHARIASFDQAQFQSGVGSELTRDDVSQHLLLVATPNHLPPPGIEQVFETDIAKAPTLAREKSKLPREERIRLMKMRRESAKNPVSNLAHTPSDEDTGKKRPQSWGPTTEVVEELKDVIWKVGERRRKFAQTIARTDSHIPTLHHIPSDAEMSTVPTSASQHSTSPHTI